MNVKAMFESFQYDVYSTRQERRCGKFAAYAWILLYYADGALKAVICKFKGHRWVDAGFGGPESGYMGATCTRCYESWDSFVLGAL